jgi:hypothetical protein
MAININPVGTASLNSRAHYLKVSANIFDASRYISTLDQFRMYALYCWISNLKLRFHFISLSVDPLINHVLPIKINQPKLQSPYPTAAAAACIQFALCVDLFSIHLI